MKKIFSLMMAMTLCWVSAEACMKKSPASTELTVIVMDTTQALLPEAQVKIGKQVYKTSFDGRVVLKPEQVTSNVLTISCEGYKKAQFTILSPKGHDYLAKPNFQNYSWAKRYISVGFLERFDTLTRVFFAASGDSE